MAQPDTLNSNDDNVPDTDNQLQIENALEQSGSEDGGDFAFDTQFEGLEAYKQSPIDLNKATEEELNALGLLSALQVQALIDYREKLRSIVTLYELANIPTFDMGTIQSILPYVRVSGKLEKTKPSLLKMLQYSQKQLFMRWQRVLEKQKGYEDPATAGGSTYLGSPDRLYSRFRMSYKNDISIGVTMEKDPGEEFFAGSNKKGFDFYSGHIFLNKPTKWLKTLAIGDFTALFGQGLTVWGGFGTRKGANVTNIRRQPASTLRAYTSAGEALFFRGVGATFAPVKHLELTTFVSYRQRDANVTVLDTADITRVLEVSSELETGFHRTPSELADRNQLKELTTGANLKWRGQYFRFGANTVYTSLSSPLVREAAPYNRFYFAGQNLFNGSIDYAAFYKGWQVFGETAVSDNGGIATLNGAIATLDERVDFSILHRYYSRNYQTIWGNPFGETSGANNENGLYVGMATNLTGKIRMSAYIDAYRFKWLRYGVDAPSDGHEIFVKMDFAVSRQVSAYVQFRDETKGRNLVDNESIDGSHLDELQPYRRTSLRAHLSYAASPEFDLRSRIELVRFKDDAVSNGFMIYQDVIWKPAKSRLRIQGRLAIFDTRDFDSRIYAYENDVLYAFSVPAYYSKGMRFYVNAMYPITRKVTLWLRYGRMYFADRNVVGSGLDEIQGSSRSELKVQLRVKF